MTRRIIATLAILLAAGCTTSSGHRRETVDLGLSFLGVKIVSVARITTEHVGEPAARAGARMTGATPEIPAAFKLLDTSDGLRILDIGPPSMTLPQPPGPPGMPIPGSPGGGADTSPPTGGTRGTPDPVPPGVNAPGTTPQPPPVDPLRTECLYCERSLYYTDDGLRDLAARGLDPDICGSCAKEGGR